MARDHTASRPRALLVGFGVHGQPEPLPGLPHPSPSLTTGGHENTLQSGGLPSTH